MLFNSNRPKPSTVFLINRSRQKNLLGDKYPRDSCGPPAEKHAKWKKIICLNSIYSLDIINVQYRLISNI